MTEEPRRPGSYDNYQDFAETVGMVPSVNPKDNLFQVASVALGTLLGALIGWTWAGRSEGAFVGGFLGIVVSAFLSGFVLMVLGMVRAARRKR